MVETIIACSVLCFVIGMALGALVNSIDRKNPLEKTDKVAVAESKIMPKTLPSASKHYPALLAREAFRDIFKEGQRKVDKDGDITLTSVLGFYHYKDLSSAMMELSRIIADRDSSEWEAHVVADYDKLSLTIILEKENKEKA